MHSLLRDHPDVFRKIQGTVDEIMADGKVDIFDLPNLIRLCSQIYHEHLVGYAIQHVGVISLIQFTLDALLDSGILPIHGGAKDILKKVIDSSLELLNANVSSIPSMSCFRFLNCGSKKQNKPIPSPQPIAHVPSSPPPVPSIPLLPLPPLPISPPPFSSVSLSDVPSVPVTEGKPAEPTKPACSGNDCGGGGCGCLPSSSACTGCTKIK